MDRIKTNLSEEQSVLLGNRYTFHPAEDRYNKVEGKDNIEEHKIILKIINQQSDASLDKSYGDVWRRFIDRASIAYDDSRKTKLIIFLDSLDQLSSENKPQLLPWLPKTTLPNVKIVISTLPNEEYEYMPRLKMILPNDNFHEVNQLLPDEVQKVINSWSANNKRLLTKAQSTYIIQQYLSCPYPLYLKLLLDEAKTWKHYREDLSLPKDSRDAINKVFRKLEDKLGTVLVSHALGYLTAANSGLSDAEMEDILSLDDNVLNEVYQYWTPPIRRIPPSIWIQLKLEIVEYIASRESGGTTVNNWYHRQFAEAARDRYLNQEAKLLLHKRLVEYFAGIWANKPKPIDPMPKPKSNKNLEKEPHKLDQETKYEDRKVRAQENIFGRDKNGNEIYNLRKLNELWHHLIEAGDIENLKSLALFDYHLLQITLNVIGLSFLQYFLKRSKHKFPEDEDIRIFSLFLKSVMEFLHKSPEQLASNILGRLEQIPHCKGSHYFKKLFATIDELVKSGSIKVVPIYGNVIPFLEKTCIPDHNFDIKKIWSSKDGNLVFTMAGTNLCIFNVNTDERNSASIDQRCHSIIAIENGQQIILDGVKVCKTKLGHFTLPTYHFFQHIPTAACLTTDGTYFIRLMKEKVEIFDISKGKYPCVKEEGGFVGHEEKHRFVGKITASKHFYAYILTKDESDIITVADLDDSTKKDLVIREAVVKVKTDIKEVVKHRKNQKLEKVKNWKLQMKVHFDFNADESKFIVLLSTVTGVEMHIFDCQTWDEEVYHCNDEKVKLPILNAFLANYGGIEKFILVTEFFIISWDICNRTIEVNQKEHLPDLPFNHVIGIKGTSKMISSYLEGNNCTYIYDLSQCTFVPLVQFKEESCSIVSLNFVGKTISLNYGDTVIMYDSMKERRVGHYESSSSGFSIVRAALHENVLITIENDKVNMKARIMYHNISDGDRDVSYTSKCIKEEDMNGRKQMKQADIRITKTSFGIIWRESFYLFSLSNGDLLRSIPSAYSVSIQNSLVVVSRRENNINEWVVLQSASGNILNTIAHVSGGPGYYSGNITKDKNYFFYYSTDNSSQKTYLYAYNLHTTKIDDRIELLKGQYPVLAVIFKEYLSHVIIISLTQLVVFKKKPQNTWDKTSKWQFSHFFTYDRVDHAKLTMWQKTGFGMTSVTEDETKLVTVKHHGKSSSMLCVYDIRNFENETSKLNPEDWKENEKKSLPLKEIVIQEDNIDEFVLSKNGTCICISVGGVAVSIKDTKYYLTYKEIHKTSGTLDDAYLDNSSFQDAESDNADLPEDSLEVSDSLNEKPEDEMDESKGGCVQERIIPEDEVGCLTTNITSIDVIGNHFLLNTGKALQVWNPHDNISLFTRYAPEDTSIILGTICEEERIITLETTVGNSDKCQLIMTDITSKDEVVLKDNILWNPNHSNYKVVLEASGCYIGCFVNRDLHLFDSNSGVLLDKFGMSTSFRLIDNSAVIHQHDGKKDMFFLYNLTKKKKSDVIVHKKIKGVIECPSVYNVTEDQQYILFTSTDQENSIHAHSFEAKETITLHKGNSPIVAIDFTKDNEQIIACALHVFYVFNKQKKPQWKKVDQWKQTFKIQFDTESIGRENAFCTTGFANIKLLLKRNKLIVAKNVNSNASKLIVFDVTDFTVEKFPSKEITFNDEKVNSFSVSEDGDRICAFINNTAVFLKEVDVEIQRC